MSFIKISPLLELQAGVDASKALKIVFQLIKKQSEENDWSLKKTIDELISSEFGLDALEKKLVNALRQWANKVGSRDLEDLFVKISEIERRSTAKDRKIGWPSKEWAKKFNDTKEGKTYSFSISAKGGVYFEVLGDGQDGPSEMPDFDTYAANAKIVVDGSLAGQAKGSIEIPYGGVKADIGAGVGRSYSAFFGIPDHDKYTGLALASALSLVDNPADGIKVLESFDAQASTKLNGLVIEGEGNFGGKLGISAKFPTQYGTPGIELNGELSFSDEFRYSVTKLEKENSLQIQMASKLGKASGGGLSLSYTVGLSTIAPKAAQDLLIQMTGIHGLIVKVDEKIEALADDLKTWLKPGDLIKKELSKHVAGALDEIRGDAAEDTTVLGGLARLFGVNGSFDDTDNTDTLTKYLTQQVTSVIADIVDELPDVMELDAESLAKELLSVFDGAVDDKVKEVLNTKVFEKVRTELDKKLIALAEKIDDEAEEILTDIEAFLKVDLNDSVAKLKAFITRVREISQKVLDGISKAQTGLLTAEIGFQLSVTQKERLEYIARYDLNEAEAQIAYKDAIIRPKSFGNILLTTEDLPKGVTATSIKEGRSINASTGHRWNVAFIGIPFGASSDRIEDVDIDFTKDGVTIATKGVLEKKSKLWNETRKVSFVSAMNILQAKPENGQGDAKLDIGAAASISINFEESDKNTHRDEVEKLMKRFVKAGLVSDNVYKAVSNEVRAQMNLAGDQKLDNTLTIGLGVPPDLVIELLKKSPPQGLGLASGGSGLFKQASIEALAMHDAVNIDQTAIMAGDKSAPLGLAGEPIVETEEVAFRRRVRYLKRIERKSRRGQQGLGSHRIDRRREEQRETGEAELASAVHAMDYVVGIAADLYQNTAIPKAYEISAQEFEAQSEALADYVEDRQKAMNKAASRFLRAGIPNPTVFGFLGGRVPRRTVAMFAALQNVAAKVQINGISVTPPIIITVKPKTGRARSFISAPE